MFVRSRMEDEVGHVAWRLDWVLAVVLLRAVGHVLDKVDGAADPLVRQVLPSFTVGGGRRTSMRFSATSSTMSATASSRSMPSG